MNQLRRDPITGIWTIIVQNGKNIDDLKSDPSHRTSQTRPDETCLFCRGREHETPSEVFAIRSEGSPKNDSNWRVRVVPEKFPVLQIHGDLNNRGLGIYDMYDGIGAHEVIIETPDHNKTMADLSQGEVAEVLTAYRERIEDLKRDKRFRYVLIHKSVSDGNEPQLRHSYSNVLATPITPQTIRHEFLNAKQFFSLKERCIFCDVIRQELEAKQKVVAENDRFLALCPFAARTPFEIWILPKQHETFFESNNELNLLADILHFVLRRIREMLGDPNYILEVHSGPNLLAGKRRGYWKTVERDFHWHIEIIPKLRGYSAFEMGFGFNVNWVNPEKAAEILRQPQD